MASSPLTNLLGSSLLGKSGKVNSNSIDAEVVGIYFSAHWCPPCRSFTPKLIGRYREALQLNKSFEIVFVSSDRDESSFLDYYNLMPWLAIPYNDTSRRQMLNEKYKVRGIPCLILVNNEGLLLNADGRSSAFEVSFLSSLPESIDPAIKGLSIDDVLQNIDKTHDLNEEQKKKGLQTVGVVISNLLNNIGDPKYMTLKKDNPAVQTKLGHPEFIRLLKMSGFKEYPEFYRCAEDPDKKKLKEVFETLKTILSSMNSTESES